MEDKFKKQALIEAVNQLQIKDFKVPNGFIIPLRNMIYVKKEHGNNGMNITDSGLIMPNSPSTNTVIPCVGVIYAVGSTVDDFLFPSLRVTFIDAQYLEVMINGEIYLRMYDHEVLGILPPKSWVYQGVRSETYIRRYKSAKLMEEFHPKNLLREENKLDKNTEQLKVNLKKVKK